MSEGHVTYSSKLIENCKKKVAYPSETHADRGATGAWAKRQIRLYPYVCPICKKWHLTSKPWKKVKP